MPDAVSSRDISSIRLTTQEGQNETPASETVRAFLALAHERIMLVKEVEAKMRAEMLEDRRFRSSDQWPDTIKNDRQNDGRPCLTINRIPEFLRQVTNTQRQNRPAVKLSPVDSGADIKTAQVIQGIIRNIENQSDADVAYTHAGNDQVEMGRGYWRYLTERADERSFEQEIRIKRVANPFSVYMDPTCNEADCSDARFAFITEDIPRRAFKDRFGEAAMSSLTEFAMKGDQGQEWMPEGKVRIAEYYYVEYTERKLLEMETRPAQVGLDGQEMSPAQVETFFEDEIEEMTGKFQAELETMMAGGPRPQGPAPSAWLVLDDIPVKERHVKWALISGAEILEGEDVKDGEEVKEGRDWPGKYIPIVPVHGDEIIMNGERDLRGMVRDARDVQRMVNYWESALTEGIALAPKAPFIIAKGQVENFEFKWNSANKRNWPYLEYNPIDSAGKPVPPPQRVTSEPPIQAMVLAGDRADKNLQSVMGFHETSLGNVSGQERSGKAIMALQKQAELGSSNYLDNLGRSIRFGGRILVDLIPKIYSEAKIMRILGDDDKPSQVMVHAGVDTNPNLTDEQQEQQGLAGVYDLAAGRYDVTISVGRSFETRRKEATETLQELIKIYPEMLPLVGDIMTENMDVPWARQVSARLKLLLPPAVQDEEANNVPPVVAAKMQQLQQQIEQLTATIEEQAQKIATDEVKQSGQLHIKREEMQSKERIATESVDSKEDIARLEAKVDLLIANMKVKLDAAKAEESEKNKVQISGDALKAKAKSGENASR